MRVLGQMGEKMPETGSLCFEVSSGCGFFSQKFSKRLFLASFSPIVLQQSFFWWR
jgi:hypothetical protein